MPPSALQILRNALALDAGSHEADPIPLYRRAIRLGLPPRALHTAFLCLGSSLRTVGHTKAAITTLQKARRRFPNDPAITLFLPLAHADAGQERLALRQLADRLLKESHHPRLAPFRPALTRKYHALR